MKQVKLISVLLFTIITVLSCSKQHNQEALDAYFEGSLSKLNRSLTDVIVADIFTPPVSSRIYAYSNIAAYEGIRFMDDKSLTLAGQLNDLDLLPLPKPNKQYYYPLCSMVAFTTTAKALVYNLEKVEEIQKKFLDDLQDIGIDPEIYSNSVALGKEIGEKVLQRANRDGYKTRTSLPRYNVNDDPERWRPTPPDYMEAIEPHWNTITPFVLKSASQFDSGTPTTFDTDKDSKFFKEAMEVYNVVKEIDSSKLEIAKFWDCNPNISNTNGHVMFFRQQISPGGHWVHIAAQVLEKEKTKPFEAAKVMAKVSIGIADAFISCWDEKYQSNLIRPETYINKYMDSDWTPHLQTPAFPEHTSGHSVASACAATILTHIFGDNYAFVDRTEVPFGLPVRSFSSFKQAAEEAAISRLYGGIHYRPAIELGVSQGKNVGAFVLENLNFN